MRVRVTEYLPGHPREAIVRTITIADECPRCGGPRGKPRPVRIIDGTRASFLVDRWYNSCSHHDLYVDVLTESRQPR